MASRNQMARRLERMETVYAARRKQIASERLRAKYENWTPEARLERLVFLTRKFIRSEGMKPMRGETEADVAARALEMILPRDAYLGPTYKRVLEMFSKEGR
jgi:hypothetical protein